MTPDDAEQFRQSMLAMIRRDRVADEVAANLTAAAERALSTRSTPSTRTRRRPVASVGHQATQAEKKAALAAYERQRGAYAPRQGREVRASAAGYGWPELGGELPPGYVYRHW
jgi:hypothetical protein